MNPPEKIKIQADNISFFYGRRKILQDVSAQVAASSITAVIGPSGQGKSTFLMIMNRLWEQIPETRMEGRVHMLLKNKMTDIYAGDVSLPDLRRSVGMVFQNPILCR